MRTMPPLGRLFAAVLLNVFTTWSSSAEVWPQRMVRFIVPLPPGTATDLVARLVADKLAERWHQPVVIENRQGGDGIPGVVAFLNAHDSHTLLCSFAGIITINPLIYDKLPYDPARDLVPIVSLADNFIGIAVSSQLNVASLNDLVKLAHSNPGKLNWAATPGVPQYAFLALQKNAGVKMIEVSYRSFTPALQDIGEGRIQAVVTGLSLLLPQVNAGKIKLLMLTGRQRSPQVPDVPTARELGYPELTFDSVVGLYGWRGMPADLKERILADVRAVAADPAIAERVASMGSVLRVDTSAAFAAAIEGQRAQIAAIARDMKPDR